MDSSISADSLLNQLQVTCKKTAFLASFLCSIKEKPLWKKKKLRPWSLEIAKKVKASKLISVPKLENVSANLTKLNQIADLSTKCKAARLVTSDDS